MGYQRAGFEVTGIDVKPQPRYPFKFHQGDAFDFLAEHWQKFDIIHASPPCQGYSVTKSFTKSKSPLLIGETRSRLKANGKPYVIENVVGASRYMENPIRLRGNQFGLRVIRDRLFEINPWILSSPLQTVVGTTNSHRGMSTGGEYITVVGHNFLIAEARLAMGISWMNQKEIAQAIPPAYTEWIGNQLMAVCFARR